MKVAYQGAPGAYSEGAAATLFPDEDRVPERTFADVFEALRAERVRAAVVPVENTLAGSVVDVYDLLREHDDVTILGEVAIRIRHCLLGVPGARLEDIRTARSHAVALAQVDEYLRAHGIEPEVAYDTAGAAQEVALAGDRSVAAVAGRGAAESYGLDVLVEGIETVAHNYTRFFAIARRTDHVVADRLAPASGQQKTSLVYATKNMPGALVRSLQPFATAGIQLTKIESRPSRTAPWEYVFYLDFEGHPAVSPAREALALMETCCEWIHVIGTYRATHAAAAERAR
jgi:prephenate dehydratase